VVSKRFGQLMTSATRHIGVVANKERSEAVAAQKEVANSLKAAGLNVLEVDSEQVEAVNLGKESELELVIALGGDGTILRGAELAHPHGCPVLGVNLGHVGFLAEAEREQLTEVSKAVVARTWVVEERPLLMARILRADGSETTGWAVNDVALERVGTGRMIELGLSVDGRKLSSWGADGVVVSTPTGSTAYAFSAGGPIIWPDVEALLIVPVSAHALFAKPLVVSPKSVVAIDVLGGSGRVEVVCDGRRSTQVDPGAQVRVEMGQQKVRLARLTDAPFTDRLVAKFRLPVEGWRTAR
jgi:NAD+ kinase